MPLFSAITEMGRALGGGSTMLRRVGATLNNLDIRGGRGRGRYTRSTMPELVTAGAAGSRTPRCRRAGGEAAGNLV
ncbi:hypothetical protein KCP75_13420 [Salmonella enterica subsp. enterica]|nr:hypothetical protein KCP75_13420 [Salmonella enterica subsp. enterica]